MWRLGRMYRTFVWRRPINKLSISVKPIYTRLQAGIMKAFFKINSAKKQLKKQRSMHFGARPLKRVIIKQVMDPIAQNILQGDIAPGHELLLDFKNDKLTIFRIKQSQVKRINKEKKETPP